MAFWTLSKVFSAFGQLDKFMYHPLVEKLVRVELREGTILWQQGDAPDGLYIIESGVLRASYGFQDRAQSDSLDECMVGGTLAGELSALSNLPRNATVTIEKDAILWKLSITALQQLQTEYPTLAQDFVRLVLKGLC